MISLQNKELSDAMDNIIDTITCGDGGLALIKFMALLQHLEKKDDKDSKTLMKVVIHFSKMIQIANQEM